MITKKLINCFILIISLCATISYSAENTIVETTIMPFYDALKNGDVVAVEAYIGDPLYSQVKVLLQDNQEYPDYLRQYYSNSYIEVTNVSDQSADYKNVYLDLYLSSSEKQSIELQLHKTTTGDWKVTKQTVIEE